MLNTERYQYLIYSWDYGVELLDLFGEPISYVCPELERRITEALLQDDRIEEVDGFEFEVSGGTVKASFTVHTVFGLQAVFHCDFLQAGNTMGMAACRFPSISRKCMGMWVILVPFRPSLKCMAVSGFRGLCLHACFQFHCIIRHIPRQKQLCGQAEPWG